MKQRSSQPRGIDLLVQPERVEASLWRSLHGDSAQKVRQHLFDHYQPLAERLAAVQFYKRKAGSCELGDVKQLAYEGLLQSIGRFDPERGVPFAVFCRRRIHGNISSGLESATEMSAQYGYRRKIDRERLRSLAVEPTAEEEPLAALSRLTALLAIGLIVEDSTSMDPDKTPSKEPSAYESLAWREMQQNLDATIDMLDERAGFVITQHYVKGINFSQIAEVLGVTKGRVSQIHRAALLRLRELMGRYR